LLLAETNLWKIIEYNIVTKRYKNEEKTHENQTTLIKITLMNDIYLNNKLN